MIKAGFCSTRNAGVILGRALVTSQMCYLVNNNINIFSDDKNILCKFYWDDDDNFLENKTNNLKFYLFSRFKL